MAIRIGKIARDLNVGVKNIIDFLQKKGFEDISESDINKKLTDEQECLLTMEFSQDRELREEAALKLRSQKQKHRMQQQPPVEEVEVAQVERPAEPAIRIKTVGKIKLENTETYFADSANKPIKPIAPSQQPAPSLPTDEVPS